MSERSIENGFFRVEDYMAAPRALPGIADTPDQVVEHFNGILRDWYNEQDQFAPIKAVFKQINKVPLRPPPLPPSKMRWRCKNCSGSGRVTRWPCFWESKPCPSCDGAGHIESVEDPWKARAK